MRPSAEAIADLALVVGAIALGIFLLVTGVLLATMWRYRLRPGAPEPRQIAGDLRLEIGWTVAPLLALAAVFVLMLGTMREIGASLPIAADTDRIPLRVTVVAHQFWWEYRFDGGAVAANELHIPVGVPVELDLVAADVIHDFWVPALAGKSDIVPGKTNHLRLFARQPGTYEGACAEFCGVQHAWMRLVVFAEPEPEFDRWLAVQGAARQAPAGEAARGEQVFLRNVCVSCHALRGTGAAGNGAAPDLTHVGGRTTIGTGVLRNDAAAMRAWLADPQRYKPGSAMPLVRLDPGDLDALVAYMESLH